MTSEVAAAAAFLSPVESMWDQFKAWAATEVAAIEGGVEAFAAKVEPVVEADLVAAVKSFGQAVVADVVSLLSSGLSSGETLSTAADNLIMKVEAQGSQIAVATANTIASQAVAAAQSIVGAKVSSSG